jgi:sterol desaturase/sphingolipid hydroxylase (fatty acid hydroxylase superfamily)
VIARFDAQHMAEIDVEKQVPALLTQMKEVHRVHHAAEPIQVDHGRWGFGQFKRRRWSDGDVP